MRLQKGELWNRRRWTWSLSHFPRPAAHVLTTRASVRYSVSFLELEYIYIFFFFFFWLFASSLSLDDVVVIPETPLASRLACLTPLSACKTVWLFMGGRYAIVHLYMCYIKYIQHSLAKSHYHIKATGEKLRYFWHHIHVHVQVTWRNSCGNNTKKNIISLTQIILLLFFFLSLLLNQDTKNHNQTVYAYFVHLLMTVY
jgi:hypothetical protein